MPGPTPPSAAEVRAQLEHMLSSPDFAASDRQKGFLRFVVEATLAGQAESIKGFTIATEVFGRGDDFDPQADPIVRVEAGRLRSRLEGYYAAAGSKDPIVVEIPRGTYVPRFSHRETGERAASGSAAPPRVTATAGSASTHRPTRLAALGVVALVVVGLGSWWLWSRGEPAAPPGGAAAAPGLPLRILVMPFGYSTDTNRHPLFNDGLVNELITTLAGLPDVEILALSTAREALSRGMSPERIAETLQVDYLVRGEVRQQGSDIRADVTLVEASTSVIRAARHFEGTSDHVFALEEKVARGIAESLALSTSPVFESRIRARQNQDPEILALYYEAATLRDPPSDPVRSRLAEEAYRRIIELDPDFAGAYAGLSYVLAYRSWWRVGEQPDIDGQRALEAARLAVEKDPELGWAQMSLALCLNITGDHERALQAARRAAELSADDPYVLAFSALVQTFEGQVNDAVPLARRAVRLDPLSPRRPFRNVLGAILFQAGQYQESIDVLQENLDMGGPDGPHVAHWRAGSLAALGRREEARRELGKAAAFPYPFDMRDFLAAFRAPRDRDKLLNVLRPLSSPSGGRGG